MEIDKEVFGERHPMVAVGYNNLGAAWADLGEHRRTVQANLDQLKET